MFLRNYGGINLQLYPMAVWWASLAEMSTWVTDRGINVFIWDSAIHFMPGDWEKAHQNVEALRQKGYKVYVIRHPAYLLTPDKLDITFDQKWKSHILAFNLADEFEDKQGGNVYGNPQPIIDYVKATVAAYKNWMPDVPIFANFNGSHPIPALQPAYQSIVNAGIDILCSDNYPICNQQVQPNGTLLFPDIMQGVTGATKLFKSWFPNKPVWTFFECCNQDLHKAGDPGWATPWKFVGSRCPTTDELWQMTWWVDQYKGDGIAWFPQAHGGGIIDATPASLIPTMLQISQHQQTLVTPPMDNAALTAAVLDLQGRVAALESKK